jgi:hypothetical protein
MARQYYPSALFTYRTQYIHVRPIPCQQGRRFSDCEWTSGPADMESGCDGTESAAAENQQRTVHQSRDWKEGQLLTEWNQQRTVHQSRDWKEGQLLTEWNQQRTVHQSRDWKEGQLLTEWNQQYIKRCTARRTWADYSE